MRQLLNGTPQPPPSYPAPRHAVQIVLIAGKGLRSWGFWLGLESGALAEPTVVGQPNGRKLIIGGSQPYNRPTGDETMAGIRTIASWILAVAAGAWLSGCASQATTPATTQAALTGETQVKKPFMFNEADLPAGFPAPGPIDQVIVKTYPPARAARVTTSTMGANADENRMFSPLFNHIKKNDIAMSSPVEMTRDEQSHKTDSMAFYYGNTAIGKPGADGNVEVVDLPALTVLSVGVRGSYNQNQFDAGLEKLIAWLAANPNQYKIIGPPRMLGYNSPFVPWFWRYSEVQLPVEVIKN